MKNTMIILSIVALTLGCFGCTTKAAKKEAAPVSTPAPTPTPTPKPKERHPWSWQS